MAEPAAATIPSWLPQHFGIGLGASPTNNGIYGWMPSSGIPWDFAYQYLSGGVNTGSGWETWNASGQFPLYYAQGAASHGYIPVFPYYELRQSNGSCGGCSESQVDTSNLANASTMNAYYQNFALLMKRLGNGNYDSIAGFGKTVIVDVEPDLSGYAEQAAPGGDPTRLTASVASSGLSDVSAYPNTYAGFNQALLHLRDEYGGPNVRLGFHISNWATGQDIGSSTDTGLNPSSLGQQAGGFAGASGVSQSAAGTSTYDVLFNDVLDRDAGQYQALYGSNRWWDRLNVSYPNFHRWEQYLSAVVSNSGGKPVLLWQVPVGNQYFDTENNSNGHYQDNRAEYIFGHISELQQSGIVGAMFGPGNSGSTQYYDSDGDGVTNPASFCTSAGMSSGQICNNHTSSQSDDDGGYLRMAAQSYYAGLSGATATPTATSTISTPTATASAATPTATAQAGFTTSASASPASVTPGGTVTVNASVTSAAATNVLVDVEAYTSSGQKVFQSYADNQSFTAGQTRTYSIPWQVPSTTAAGTYTLVVGIFAPGWGSLEAWNGSAGSLTVSAVAPTSTPVPPSPTPTNTPLPATATPTRTPLPPTATATPASAAYALGASVSPGSLSAGQSVTITSSVKPSAAATVLVDVEVYSASGVKMFQQYWDNQTFTANQTRTYSATWSVPAGTATGAYTVDVAVFGSGWGTLYSWDGGAATITVH
ncbi:MAG: hypothetical protein JO023_19835 [Chloroflexi bacterium]|nr:hypothetical protein [Chloroflexota bacterium]